MTLIILTGLLLFLYLLLLLAYTLGWHKPAENISGGGALPSLSVLIPARNEADNIVPCLRSILNCHYPPHLLEIIVIDDYSEDETAALASALLQGGKGKVLRLETYLSPEQRLNAYKKKALEIAVAEARGTWIITTDADCTVPPGWLNEMSKAMLRPGARFIAAPVSFSAPRRKDVLYYFQSLDFMTMQGITAASARLRTGNMCNGANLAFQREAFYQVGGYTGIDHIASGDDMLLMHKIEQQYPDSICYLKSAKAIVTTPAQDSWPSFLNQRIRWSSKAGLYDDKKLTLILSLVYFFNLSFIVLAVAGCFDTRYWLWMLAMLAAKVAAELLFLFPVATFYHKTKELICFPLLQPLHILYIVVAGFLGKFGSYQWKGRKVK